MNVLKDFANKDNLRTRTDFEDVKQLMDIEQILEEAYNQLSGNIDKAGDLEIILLDQLKLFEIKETLSPRNKFLTMRTKTDDYQTMQWIDEWLRREREIKKLKLTIKQVSGKRDSLKKKISTLPTN